MGMPTTYLLASIALGPYWFKEAASKTHASLRYSD